MRFRLAKVLPAIRLQRDKPHSLHGHEKNHGRKRQNPQQLWLPDDNWRRRKTMILFWGAHL
jgi:hypothetical protein